MDENSGVLKNKRLESYKVRTEYKFMDFSVARNMLFIYFNCHIRTCHFNRGHVPVFLIVM